MIKALITTTACVFALTQIHVHAITVPGTSDPWLAGMPDGSTASQGDVAPDESPVLVFPLPGSSFTWSATGEVSHGNEVSGPDGGSLTAHATGAENGISNVGAPINSLLGVFLDDSQPDSSAAPDALDFNTDASSRDYLSLSPLLKQVFFMGDGLTSGAEAQEIVVPAGATRLFLGTMDGFGWFNNTGAFEVTLNPNDTVPTPDAGSTALLLVGSLALLSCFKRVS